MALDPQQVEELLSFLAPTARMDVRCVAMQYFLGLTGSDDGRAFLADKEIYLDAIVELLKDEQETVSKDAFLALVNLSTDPLVAEKLLSLPGHPKFFVELLTYITKEDSPHADIACTVASNISRSERCAQYAVDSMMKEDATIGFERLVFVFCQKGYNKKNCKLDYLGPFFSNLTQIRSARFCIMDKRRCVLQRLLPFVEYEESTVRRGGIIAALHNCCFETSYHEWLLSEDIDILPRLLLPLAGPEEFDDDDMEKLPADLQYLEPDKKREPDPDIRKMLIESVTQLCALQKCRLYIKEKNTYVILRELHNWEKDPAVKLALEDPIQLMIGDEPEAGMENLNEVEIPEDVVQKLEKAKMMAEKDVEEEYKKLEEEEKKTKEEEEKKMEEDAETVNASGDAKS